MSKVNIKEPHNKVTPKTHDDYIVCGIDPGNNCSIVLMDTDYKILKVGHIKGWELMAVYGLFSQMMDEYHAKDIGVLVGVETTSKAVFGPGGVKRGLDSGQLIGRIEGLISVLEHNLYHVIPIKNHPRNNPYLKMPSDVMECFFPDFTTQSKNGAVKPHQTNEHERDAMGIAICTLDELVNP